jgi:protein-L-isoaspartate(D-aspartate) O-methyltransferase
MHSIPWSLPFVALFRALGRKTGSDRHREGDLEARDSGPESTADQGRAAPRDVEREGMVRLIVQRGIREPRLLAALRQVARHAFVPIGLESEAYADRALPIGEGQTISQPYIVALMTQALELTPGSRVLEIGTGSGYQTAILCELAREVTTIELWPELSREASALLAELGYTNVECRVGDGGSGALDRAPFDAIIVTAAPDRIPRALVDQLAIGGRMCIPVGDTPPDQRLLRIHKQADGSTTSAVLASVRFVPMLRRRPSAGISGSDAVGYAEG